MLAHLSGGRVRSILTRHGMQRGTPRTIVTAAGMDAELARIRRQGYALDDVEFEEGVRCVGAPILDHRGVPIAAMSVSAPVSRMPRAKAHRLGRMLCHAVAEVSRALGWKPGVGAVVAEMHATRGLEGRGRGGRSRRRSLVDAAGVGRPA